MLYFGYSLLTSLPLEKMKSWKFLVVIYDAETNRKGTAKASNRLLKSYPTIVWWHPSLCRCAMNPSSLYSFHINYILSSMYASILSPNQTCLTCQRAGSVPAFRSRLGWQLVRGLSNFLYRLSPCNCRPDKGYYRKFPVNVATSYYYSFSGKTRGALQKK